MIRKLRKTINGVEIVLLEKSVVPTTQIQDNRFSYSNVESKLRSYIDTQISEKIQIVQPTQESQPVLQSQVETLFSSYTLTVGDFLTIVSNDPEDGSVLTYDGQGVNLVWKQTPNIRLTAIENKISNYDFKFVSDHTFANKFHMPFAIKSPITNEVWGGSGKAGIFWLDPWDKPVDNFSIKMGKDDASIGETGYTFGQVTGLAMKFSNGPEILGGIRGFVWNSHNRGPVMALDSQDPAVGGGSLTVNGRISSKQSSLYVAPFNAETFVGANALINIGGSYNASYEGYVATYTRQMSLGQPGVIKLMPPTGGGSGGGTFPGVEIDGGSFLMLDQYAEIDAGSFV